MEVEHQEEIILKGKHYECKVYATIPKMLQLELTDGTSRWKSTFSATYVEEMTQKTGNYKKFEVFVEMLISALVGESGCVALDLLTPLDLHLKPSDKIYLVLVYSVAFDRVFYPLPLSPTTLIKHSGGPAVSSSVSVRDHIVTEMEQAAQRKLMMENLELKKQLSELISERSSIERAFEDVKVSTKLEFEKIQFQLAKDMESNQHLDRLYSLVQQLMDELANASRILEDKNAEIERLKSKLAELERKPPSTSSRRGVQSSPSLPRRVERSPSVTRRVASSPSLPKRPVSVERSPSVSSHRSYKRFDPTAYVREKQERERSRSVDSRKSAYSASSARSDKSRLSTRITSLVERLTTARKPTDKKKQKDNQKPVVETKGQKKDIETRLQALSEYFERLKVKR